MAEVVPSSGSVQVKISFLLHEKTHGRAMGEDSEQSVEASHGRFSKLWESYIVYPIPMGFFLLLYYSPM